MNIDNAKFGELHWGLSYETPVLIYIQAEGEGQRILPSDNGSVQETE
jgi:hypothetical protein